VLSIGSVPALRTTTSAKSVPRSSTSVLARHRGDGSALVLPSSGLLGCVGRAPVGCAQVRVAGRRRPTRRTRRPAQGEESAAAHPADEAETVKTVEAWPATVYFASPSSQSAVTPWDSSIPRCDFAIPLLLHCSETGLTRADRAELAPYLSRPKRFASTAWTARPRLLIPRCRVRDPGGPPDTTWSSAVLDLSAVTR